VFLFFLCVWGGGGGLIHGFVVLSAIMCEWDIIIIYHCLVFGISFMQMIFFLKMLQRLLFVGKWYLDKYGTMYMNMYNLVMCWCLVIS
jgi:hypothetical protein